MKAQLKGQHFHKGVKTLLMRAPTTIPVTLERDLGNKYDSNAIRVVSRQDEFNEDARAAFKAEGGSELSPSTVMLGHVDRESAATMAPKMDESRQVVTAMLSTGSGVLTIALDTNAAA